MYKSRNVTWVHLSSRAIGFLCLGNDLPGESAQKPACHFKEAGRSVKGGEILRHSAYNCSSASCSATAQTSPACTHSCVSPYDFSHPLLTSFPKNQAAPAPVPAATPTPFATAVKVPVIPALCRAENTLPVTAAPPGKLACHAGANVPATGPRCPNPTTKTKRKLDSRAVGTPVTRARARDLGMPDAVEA